MTGRTVSRDRANRRCILLVLLVVAILAVLAMTEGYRLYKRNQEYAEVRQELEIRIQEEQERSRELEAYQEYTQTREFAEWYARERLGLVRDNEIIFKSE